MQTLRRASDSWLWILGLFTLAALVETIFWGQMNAFTPLYLPTLGVPAADVARWTGLLVAGTSLVGIPFLPFWGALADRYARQPIIVRSFVVYAVAGVLTLLARDLWLFALGRAIMSLSLGNSGLMLTTLSERCPPRRIGLGFAIMNSASPVGVFLGPLVGGPVVDRWGFPTLLAINTGLMLVIILGLSLGYRDNFKGTARGSLLRMAWDSAELIARSARLRALFAALFLLFAGWIMAITYVPLVVQQLYRGDDPGTAVGLVVGTGGLLAIVLGPWLGALGDRYGHWRVLLIGATVAVVLWPLPALAPNLVIFAALWAVVNGLTSGLFAMSFSLVSQSAAPEVRGRVMSFAFLPANVGSIIGPAIGAVITRDTLFAVFPAGAVLTLVGIGVLVWARRLGGETTDT